MRLLIASALLGFVAAESSVAEGVNAVARSAFDSEGFLLDDTGDNGFMEVDPARRALFTATKDASARRKLAGDFGICLDGINVENGDLICDPANSLPQICTLQCRPGFYSTGANRDVACANAKCQGDCRADKYLTVTRDIVVTNKTCESVNAEGELVLESCQGSEYVENTRTDCSYDQEGLPGYCWGSGCSGNCDAPGVYFYYSALCADTCPPWRDPAAPAFECSPCVEPVLNNLPAGVVQSFVDGAVTYSCGTGKFGMAPVNSYCTTDGVYPTVDIPVAVDCQVCSAPPAAPAGSVMVVTAEENGNIGSVSYQCPEGLVGAAVSASCDPVTGVWAEVSAPECAAPVAAAVDVAPVAPVEVAPPAPVEVVVIAPSPSRAPRTEKVTGSRAPTPAPKVVA